MGVSIQPFGEFENKPVSRYILTDGNRLQVSAINYGATLQSILLPGKEGGLTDVILGFDTLEGYTGAGSSYIGSICGRYANRIAGAAFHLDGQAYYLAKNDGENFLHGGHRGFDKVYWDAEILPEENAVKFSYSSKDGEESFPGNLLVTVEYKVKGDALHISYRAVTDKATPVNLTSHCYFNLSGDENILEHELQLNAGRIAEVNNALIPTGKFIHVKGTPFDFTKSKKIEIVPGTEYDHSWVLPESNGELIKAAVLFHQQSGHSMTVHTTQPAIHFYSGHFLDGNLQYTKEGKRYGKYAGLCLEAQHFADSPNQSNFPNTILRLGEVYVQKTVYSFNNDQLLHI